MNSSIGPHKAPIQPLRAAGRFRERDVTRQITGMLSRAPAEFANQLDQRRAGIPLVSEEALVYLLRAAYRRSDGAAVDLLSGHLRRRCLPFIERTVHSALPSAQAAVDCIADVFSVLWENVFDLSEAQEFWEVRFWVCLRRRLLTRVRFYRRLAWCEPAVGGIEEIERISRARNERLPDLCEPLTDRIAMRRAIAHLTEVEYAVLHLYHLCRWTQPEIARVRGISDRTVRNILRRAHTRIAYFWTEQPVGFPKSDRSS